MIKKLLSFGLLFGLFALNIFAHAEVFKCKDATGRIIYGEKNEPQMACTLVTTEITVVPAIPVTQPPREPARRAENAQREALQDKVKAQEAALTEAKNALAEQAGIRLRTEVFYQSVLDRLKPYQDKVAEIEKTLAQYRTELNNAK